MHFCLQPQPCDLRTTPQCYRHTQTHKNTHAHQKTLVFPAHVLLSILLQSGCRQGLGPWLTKNTPSSRLHISLNLQSQWIINNYKYALGEWCCHYMHTYMCVCIRVHFIMQFSAGGFQISDLLWSCECNGWQTKADEEGKSFLTEDWRERETSEYGPLMLKLSYNHHHMFQTIIRPFQREDGRKH